MEHYKKWITDKKKDHIYIGGYETKTYERKTMLNVPHRKDKKMKVEYTEESKFHSENMCRISS